MDRPDAERDELWASLGDLAGVNRWLGGYRSAVRLVLEVAERVRTRPVTVVDVGTGGADVPLALVAAGRARGLELRILAIDRHPGTAEYARRSAAAEPAVRVACADAFGLPLDDGAVDVAVCSTTLHHFDRGDAVRALREMGRVARAGVVVTDLARSWPAYLGARVLAATVWRRHPITRHDGPVSVRAAFTPGEMEAMGREAFGEGVRVVRQPIFRLALVAEPRAASRRAAP